MEDSALYFETDVFPCKKKRLGKREPLLQRCML